MSKTYQKYLKALHKEGKEDQSKKVSAGKM